MFKPYGSRSVVVIIYVTHFITIFRIQRLGPSETLMEIHAPRDAADGVHPHANYFARDSAVINLNSCSVV